MKLIQSDMKHVHYVTYDYDDIAEKERHIIDMASNDYEVLERFEDANKVIYRKFIHQLGDPF